MFSAPSHSLYLNLRRRVEGRVSLDLVGTLGSNLCVFGLGSVGSVLAARLLGSEGRGVLAVAVVWAGTLGGIGQLGLPQALPYYVAREPDDIGSIFFTTAVLFGLQCVAIIALGWCLVGILARFQSTALEATRAYLFSVPCSLAVTYVSAMAQGLKRYQLYNSLRLLLAVSYSGALITAGLLGVRDAVVVVYLLLAGQAIAATVAVLGFGICVRPHGGFERGRLLQLLAYGLRAHCGNISWMANARLDQLIMSGLVDLEQLGHYAVAVSYAAPLAPLSSAFAVLLFPEVAGGARSGARSLIVRALKLNVIVTGIAAVALMLMSPFLLPLVFGPQFRPSVCPAIVLLGGGLVLGSNFVLSTGLRGLGDPTRVSIAELVGVGVTVVGLVILLPRLGILGAAVSSLLSYSVVCLWLVRFVRQSAWVSAGASLSGPEDQG